MKWHSFAVVLPLLSSVLALPAAARMIEANAPTTNADGTPLTDLAGYRVYHSPTTACNPATAIRLGEWPAASAAPTVGTVTSFDVPTHPLGGVLCATAYDTTGNESGPSNTIPAPGPKFLAGHRVVATLDVAARPTPTVTAAILQVHPVGALGTVVAGPTASDGFWWWQVNYDSGADGWSTEERLTTSAASAPAPPPPPPPVPPPAPAPPSGLRLRTSGIREDRVRITRRTGNTSRIIAVTVNNNDRVFLNDKECPSGTLVMCGP